MISDDTQSRPTDGTRTADPDATAGPVGPTAALPAGDWLEIGRGAMGVVYRATQPGLNRAVAVKMLLGEEAPRQAQRFLAEAEAVAAVEHPHVVKVFEFGRRDGRPFLAMEYLPGGTLADRLTGPPLPPADAAALVRKIALGVGAAHAAGVIHRDLKPANVLFDAAGEPKVTDFGLAKRGGGAELTHTQAVMGTPAYMSPEQAKGETKFVGPPADVWALGVILYEALTGQRPFAAADTWGLLQAVQTTDAPDVRAVRRDIPRDLAVITAKSLRKDPAERYPTANELAADLGRFLAGESILARPPGSVERALKWAARKPAVAAGWALGVVAAVSLAVTAFALKLKADADAARQQAELSAGEAKQARDAEQTARGQVERAREQLARTEYARTVNLAHREYQRNDLKRANEYLDLCRPDLRGWEWHHLHRLCHPEWEVIPEPLAGDQPFSADGLTFLTLKDGKVNVRRVGGEVVRVLQADPHTDWAAISPDASAVATVDGDTCKLWDVASGKTVRTLSHAQSIRSVAFSADGKQLFALLYPPPERPLTDAELAALSRPGTPPSDPKPNKRPEPTHAVVAAWSLDPFRPTPAVEWRKDPNVKIDPPKGVPGVGSTNLTLTGSVISLVSRLVLLPDGRLVVGASWSNAELWSADGRTAATRSSLGELFAPSPIRGCLINLDKGLLSVVDLATDKPVTSFSVGAEKATALDAHPDGDRVCVGRDDGRVEAWSMRDSKRLAEYRGFSRGHHITACRLSRDGRWLVAGSDDAVRVWRTDHPAQEEEVAVAVAAKRMSVRVRTAAADPRTLMAFDHLALREVLEGSLFGPSPEWADLHRRTDGLAALRERTSSRRYGSNAVFNRDRTTLGYLGLFWPAEGARRDGYQELEPFFETVNHDGEDLFAVWDALRGREITVRTADAAVPIRTIDAGERVDAAAFARTGHVLFVSTTDGRVTAWDTDGGRRLWTTSLGEDNRALCADASPDGKRVAVGGPDDTLLLLDAASGAVTTTLRGHTRRPFAVRFSPDGRRLVSSALHEMTVWDPETGQDLLTLDSDNCDCLDFSADGSRVLACGIRGYHSLGFGADLDLKSVGVTVAGVRLSTDLLFTVHLSYRSYGNSLTERVFDARPVRAGR